MSAQIWFSGGIVEKQPASLEDAFDPVDPGQHPLPGNSPPPCGIDGLFNAKEDFAESVTAFVYPSKAQEKAKFRGYPYYDPERGHYYPSFLNTPRGLYIKALMVSGT